MHVVIVATDVICSVTLERLWSTRRTGDIPHLCVVRLLEHMRSSSLGIATKPLALHPNKWGLRMIQLGQEGIPSSLHLRRYQCHVVNYLRLPRESMSLDCTPASCLMGP